MRLFLRFLWILALVGCRDAPNLTAPESGRKAAQLDGLPNLIVESFTVPSEVAPMQCVGGAISIVVRNSSDTNASQTFSVGVYISPDSAITYGEALLVGGRTAVRGLAPGGRVSVQFGSTLHVPAEVPQGQAYLGVLIDELDAVPESDEADNTSARRVAVRAPDVTPPPNLTITSFNGPTTVVTGQRIGSVISTTVRNSGAGPTGSGFYVGLYLSRDSLVTIADTNINRQGPAIDGGSFRCKLDPSASNLVRPATWIRVPSDYPPGRAYLGVIVDDRGTVRESDESDNVAVLPVDVVAAPQPTPVSLRVVSLIGPVCVTPGQAIDDSTQLVIRNDGPGDVRSGFQVGLFVSPDALISTSDARLVGGLVRVEMLEANRIFRVPFTGLQIPTEVSAGDMFLGAIVDELRELDENTRADNTGATPLTVRERSCSIVNVQLEIQPGRKNKQLRCAPRNKFALALLGTPEFDATRVDHTTVQFAGAREIHRDPKTGGPRRHEKDVDGDGSMDLLFHIRLGDTTLECDSKVGYLSGETFAGERVHGEVPLQMRVRTDANGAPLEPVLDSFLPDPEPISGRP